MNAHYHSHHSMWKGLKVFGMVIGGMITAVAIALAFGYFVQLLWNWLMPKIFSLSIITYWEAFGLVLLARLIFGGIGHHGHSPHHGNHHRLHHPPHPNWHSPDNWGSDEWKIKGSWNNWGHYDEWWREEGKKGFEAFIEKKKEQPEENKSK